LSSYKIVTEKVEVETPATKGSRFIGLANHAPTTEAATAFLEGVRQAHPKATHHTFAWIIDGDNIRMSDDGEPKGTAGRPIFDRIKGQGLSKTVVVVVRYYGGTKLGTGGLVRAYGGAASAVLEAASIVEKEQRFTIELRCPYDLEGPIKGIIKEYGGEIDEISWGSDVSIQVSVTEALQSSCCTALMERCGGRVIINNPLKQG
jgi:uncharacterized YigZ family protein